MTTNDTYEAGLHFEFTGETKSTPTGVVLQRICATKPLPRFDVRVGDVGGWIESESNLSGGAWVYGDARVSGGARVSGDAQVYDNAWVYGNAQVSGNARVSGDALVYDNARVSGDARVYGGANLSGDAWVSGYARVFGGARVSGGARVYGDAQVYDNAWVFGDARVSGDARVTETQHVLSVGPLGSESVNATAFRATTGHLLHVGCWHGTVDELAAEVERRAKNWQCDEPTAARWRAEYAALETLVRARITGWEASA